MPFDIYSTHTLLLTVQSMEPFHTFLRDRYFPTNDASDLFSTDDVLIEYRDGDKKLAPFVAPRKGGVTMLRGGFNMKRYTPPRIAPRRPLTIDDLKKRGFGEALNATLTPDQREGMMIARDMDEMRRYIRRREEAMAAETLIQNGCIMRHIADDKTKSDDMEIRFYDGEDNPALYTPSVDWNQPGAQILADGAAMVRLLSSRGLPATEMVVAPDVADTILADEKIQKLLDLRNYNVGGVDPAELPDGVVKIARLNFKGRMLDILSYEDTYEDDEGVKQFIPAGHVVVTAPAAGRTLYGAVTQMEQSDGRIHTYTARIVPKYLSDAEHDVRSLTLTSCPLLIPNNKTPWIVAKVQ